MDELDGLDAPTALTLDRIRTALDKHGWHAVGVVWPDPDEPEEGGTDGQDG